MKWLTKLNDHLEERRQADREAIENSRALLNAMIESEPEVSKRYDTAAGQLIRATMQAQRLRATDVQNHYSESMTHAFRGAL